MSEAKYKRVRHEDKECLAFATYLQTQKIKFFRLATEIPTNRFAVIRRLQREGWGSGQPDFHILHPSGDWHSLYVEMKSPRNDFPCRTEDQYKTLMELASLGHASYCCKDARSAIYVVEHYLHNGELVGELKTETGKQMVRCYNILWEESQNEEISKTDTKKP